MADFFSLTLLIAVSTIAIVVIGILLVAVLVRLFFILGAIEKTAVAVAEEVERIKTHLADVREKVREMSARALDGYHMLSKILSFFPPKTKEGRKKKPINKDVKSEPV